MKIKLKVIFLSIFIIVFLVGCGLFDVELEEASVHNSFENEDNVSTNENNIDYEKNMEIFSYIYGILDPLCESNISDEELDEKVIELWADAALKFNVTESEIMGIYSDTDLMKEYYSDSSTSEILTYDATLNGNGYGRIAIAESKDVLTQYINYVIDNSESEISDLLLNGQLAIVEEDVKVYVEDLGLAKTKVTVLEGLYEGFTGYVISEQVNMK